MITHACIIRRLILVNSLVILYIFLFFHTIPAFAQEDAINQGSPLPAPPAPIIGERNGPYSTRRIFCKLDHQRFLANEISIIQGIKLNFPSVTLRQVTPRVFSVTAGEYLQLRNFVNAVQASLPNIQASLDPIVLRSGQGGDSGLSGSSGGGSGPVAPQPLSPTIPTNPFVSESLASLMRSYVYDPIHLPEAFTNFTKGFTLARIGLFDTGPTVGENNFIGNEYKTPLIDSIHGVGTNLVPHGSMSYSLLASQQNGLYGIGGCPDCNFERYLLNVTSQDPIIFLTDLLSAVEDLSAHSASQVVNIGFGVPDLPQIREYLEEYIDPLSQRANLVASAGLDPAISTEGQGPAWYPASDERVIGVGATGAISGTTINPLAIAEYTNDNPDVVAPGTQIYVPTAFNGGGNAAYEPKDGTGFSTALVSSVLGLLWSEYLETPRNFPRIRGLSQAEKVEYFKNLIENTATDLGVPGRDSVFGHGLVNAQSALETMVNDQAPDVAPGLTKGFREWRQDQAGGIVWQRALSRFNTTPRTTGKINESGTFGRCASASAWDEIKVELSRPRFTYFLENFTATAQILEPENRVKVTMSYRPVIRGYVRGDYSTWLTCATHFPLPIGLTINFSYGENASQAHQEIYLKLENGKYEIEDSRIAEPPNRVWTFDVANSLPNWVSSWIIRQIEDFGEFEIKDNVQLLYPGIHTDLLDMVEKVFERTLFADQGNRSATEYFFSRLAPITSPRPSLASPRDFNHGNRISHSKYSERTPEPLYRNNIPRMTSPFPLSSPFVYSSPNPGDSSVYVGEHFYNDLLRQMYASGAFHAQYNPLLRNVSFRTIPLGLADYVNFNITGVETVHQPIFTPFAQVDPNDNIGEVLYFVNINFNYSFTKNNIPYTYNTPLLIEFHTPVMVASMYKKDDETSGALTSSKFYSKLVPDEHQLTIHGFGPDPEGVLTEQDVKVLLLNTIGMGFTRALHAPSEFMVGVDANTGNRGGIKHILEQANRSYQESSGKDLFIDLQDLDLFDLNLGYLGPGTSTSVYFQSSTNHYTKYFDPVVFRSSAPDPRASVNSPQRQLMYHPLDSNVVANNVLGTFSSQNSSEEVTVSPNRNFRAGFPPSATRLRYSMGVNVAEQLFVATLMGGGGPNTGNYLALEGVHNEYEVSGNARHIRELNFSKECDEAFKVQFDYRGSPPVIEEYYVGPYGERPIWEDKDERVRQVCDEGGSGGGGGRRNSIRRMPD